MDQTQPSALFQTGWYSFGLPGYRPCPGTYKRYPYDNIPPIPEEQFTGQLQWLVPWKDEIDEDSSDSEQQDEQTAQWMDNLANTVASARHFGLTLPQAFLRLMSSPTLLDRIPSCTDCHFTLSQLASCPGDKEEGYVLRFLHDQQDCVIWHLYLSSRGDEYVLASHVYLDQIYSDPEEWGRITEEEAIRQTWLCAPSFEAFLYRFWMENVLWYNLNGQHPLTEEQSQYLAFYGEKEQKRNIR